LETPNGNIDYPLSWEDMERDSAWATEMLRAHEIGAGDLVHVMSSGWEAPWTEPLFRAIRALGATYSCSELWGWDAPRAELFLRRLEPAMVIGIGAEVVTGIAGIADLGDRLGAVRHVLARPDAVAPLRDAGVDAGLCMLLGPAIALSCPARAGAHVNASEWAVTSTDGELQVSTVGDRAHHLARFPTALAGRIVTEACSCESRDPRVLI
jgi:hypothetical protein